MSIENPAAAALIEALKDPALTSPQRAGLVAALQAVVGSERPAAKVHAPAAPDRLRGERVTLFVGTLAPNDATDARQQAP